PDGALDLPGDERRLGLHAGRLAQQLHVEALGAADSTAAVFLSAWCASGAPSPVSLRLTGRTAAPRPRPRPVGARRRWDPTTGRTPFR
ncbi:hypothetical protein ACWDAZ_11075, partial [Streptomyces sp. NPDC001215]